MYIAVATDNLHCLTVVVGYCLVNNRDNGSNCKFDAITTDIV